MISQRVELSDRSYDIRIASGAFALAEKKALELSAQGRAAVCVADSAVAELYKERLSAFAGKVFIVEGGESAKCFAMLEKLCGFFADSRLDRSGAVFALGGGVVGDLAGFAASIYMRGIGFYQIPTTLLSMVDSSVGGKTAVNMAQGKNLVGTFYQPQEVFIDTDFLRTLPRREFAAGLAEVVKYGMICDAEFFAPLEKGALGADSERLPEIIAKCCAIKARVVAGDERETAAENGRALLNLGHTFAHAIENCAGYGNYLHGEAVSLGLLLAARMSEKMGLIAPSETERVRAVLEMNSLPVVLRSKIDSHALALAAGMDKKSRAGRLNFVLLNSIGGAFTRSGISEELLIETFDTVQP